MEIWEVPSTAGLMAMINVESPGPREGKPSRLKHQLKENWVYFLILRIRVAYQGPLIVWGVTSVGFGS